MTRSNESAHPDRYYNEILNAPETDFLELAHGISRSRDDLQKYASRCRMESPGLYQHLGGWIEAIRERLEPIARTEDIKMADGSMTSGALMTYELLTRVAERANIKMPNPPFNPQDYVDSEAPESGKLLRKGRVLDLSRRAWDMPERFPVLFQADLIMLSNVSGLDPDAVHDVVYSKIDRGGTFPYEVANFLAGAVEIVLPIERYAQVDVLEKGL